MPDTVPGPDGLPLVGNTVDLVRGQGEYIERVAAEYGPVASVSMVGTGEIVLVSDPDLVETVLFDERYEKASLARESLEELLGEGLLLAEGDAWRRKRGLVQPAFSGDQLAVYGRAMADCAREFVADLEPGRSYDAGDRMRRLTFRILLEAAFGGGVDYDRWDLRSAVDALMAPGEPRNQPIAYAVPTWVPIPMWRRYREGVRRFEAVIDTVLERRRNSEREHDDLLSVLMAAADGAGGGGGRAARRGGSAEQPAERPGEEMGASGGGGGGMTDEELRDELMTLLFAGHETTATALTFAWYLLGTHPEADRRLAEELRTTLDGPPTAADLPDLEYTGRVLTEAMRLYPPVPATGREPTTDVELGGYRIPAGTTVAPSQWIVHRSGDHYEDPHSFDPDRWARRPEADRHRFAYFPFGGGPRRCVGEEFALQEAKLILATVAREYRLAVPDPEPLDPSVSIVTQPTTDVEVVPAPRDPD